MISWAFIGALHEFALSRRLQSRYSTLVDVDDWLTLFFDVLILISTDNHGIDVVNSSSSITSKDDVDA